MNPLKAQVKIGTINELGNKFEDVKEAAGKAVFQQEGYGIAVTDFEGSIQSILEKIDEERDAGQHDLEMANLLKKTILRVQNAVSNLRMRQQKHLLLAQGQVLGIELAIKHTKKFLDVELAKVQSGAPSESTETVAHTRPDAPSSALADIEQRRAEAKAAKAAAEAKENISKVSVKKTVAKKTIAKKVVSKKG